MKDGKFTAGDIYALLLKRFSDEREWLCAGEVGNTTGGGLRRLDFVAVNCYASKGFGIHAFEIKISKSDLRRELTDPSKHNIFFANIDTYSIVAPDYVLDAEYIALAPKNWGVYQAKAAGPLGGENTLRVVRKPLALHDEHDRGINRGFAFELIRSMRGAMAERRAFVEQNYNEYRRGFIDGGKDNADRARRLDGKVAQLNNEMQDLRLFAHRVGCWSLEKSRLEAKAKEIKAALAFADAMRNYKYNFASIREKLDACEAWFKAFGQNKADGDVAGPSGEMV